ncbi:MAG: helix-turn-helix domain-containing protein [Bacteroidales bacterium]|nr:helix-turn-helix domain-containing protein [Bacteroidales bacterium]
MEPIYTVEEIAKHLNLTTRTIYTYIRSGKLKALKVGREYRIRQRDLEEFLDPEEE